MSNPAGRDQQLIALALRGRAHASLWSSTRIGQFLEHLGSVASLTGALLGLYPAMLGYPAELVTALEEGEVLAQLVGRYDAARPDGPFEFAAEVDPLTVDFPEALDWFRSRQVVTDVELGVLQGRARVRAFYVAGVADRRLADRFHSEILRALEEGTGFHDFVAAMDEEAARLDRDPFALGHLSTVFRNGVGSAYQAGRYEQLITDVAARPIWEYLAQPGARPEHAAQDGVKLPHDHPFWLVWFPPNDHNCRCGQRALTPEEAGALTELDGFPAPAWPQSPARGPQAARRAQGVVQGLQDAPLPSQRLPWGELLGSSEGHLDARHAEAMDALDRGLDADRVTFLRLAAGVTDDDLLPLLEGTSTVALHPPGWLPAARPRLELAMPSQDGAGLEELARRLGYAPDLEEVAINLAPRISVRRGVSPASPATVAFDGELADVLGDSRPVGWVGESVLELEGQTLEELAQWVLEHTEPGVGRSLVPFAGEVADLRLLGAGEANATLNVRVMPSGWQAAAITSEPLDGWDHYPVVLPGDAALEL